MTSQPRDARYPSSRSGSVIGIVVVLMLVGLLSVVAMVPMFAAAQPCPTAVMTCGPSPLPYVFALMIIGPWAAFVVGTVLTVVRWRRQSSPPPMLVASVIAVVLWVLGLVLLGVWEDIFPNHPL